MTPLLRLAMRAYPARWRKRYGAEFDALLEDLQPGWRGTIDVLTGGLRMRLHLAHPAIVMTGCAIAGAAVGGAIVMRTADRFTSQGTIHVIGKVNVWSGAMPPSARAAGVIEGAFNEQQLTALIRKHALYQNASATPDGFTRMRSDISVRVLTPTTLQVSYASSDRRAAREVTQDLINQLSLSGTAELSLQQVDAAGEPLVDVSSQRITRAGLTGFGGGALCGLLVSWLIRAKRRRG